MLGTNRNYFTCVIFCWIYLYIKDVVATSYCTDPAGTGVVKTCLNNQASGGQVILDTWDSTQSSENPCVCTATVTSATTIYFYSHNRIQPNYNGCGTRLRVSGQSDTFSISCFISGSLSVTDGEVLGLDFFKDFNPFDSRYCIKLILGNAASTITLSCNGPRNETTTTPFEPTTYSSSTFVKTDTASSVASSAPTSSTASSTSTSTSAPTMSASTTSAPTTSAPTMPVSTTSAPTTSAPSTSATTTSATTTSASTVTHKSSTWTSFSTTQTKPTTSPTSTTRHSTSTIFITEQTTTTPETSTTPSSTTKHTIGTMKPTSTLSTTNTPITTPIVTTTIQTTPTTNITKTSISLTTNTLKTTNMPTTSSPPTSTAKPTPITTAGTFTTPTPTTTAGTPTTPTPISSTTTSSTTTTPSTTTNTSTTAHSSTLNSTIHSSTMVTPIKTTRSETTTASSGDNLPSKGDIPVELVAPIAAAGGFVLILILIMAVICFRKNKQNTRSLSLVDTTELDIEYRRKRAYENPAYDDYSFCEKQSIPDTDIETMMEEKEAPDDYDYDIHDLQLTFDDDPDELRTSL